MEMIDAAVAPQAAESVYLPAIEIERTSGSYWDIPGKIDQLKTLLGLGRSASQIAGELIGISRNGVIGKVHRLGLHFARLSGSETQRLARIGREREAALVDAPRKLLDPKRAAQRQRQRQRETEQRQVERYVEPENFGATVSTEEHEHHMCAWPVGEPGTDSFRWCAGDRVKEKSYCAHHLRIAYVPASQRQRYAGPRTVMTRFGNRIEARR